MSVGCGIVIEMTLRPVTQQCVVLSKGKRHILRRGTLTIVFLATEG